MDASSGRLLRGVVRRLPIVAAIALIAAVAGYVWASSRPDQYRATTTISVSDPSYASLFVNGNGGQDTVAVAAARAMAQLQLPNVLRQARAELGRTGGGLARDAKVSSLITVSAETDTGLISVTAQTDSPDVTQRLSQAVATAFVDKRKRDETRQIQGALESARAQYDSLSFTDRRADAGAALLSRVQQLKVAESVATGGVAIVQGATLPDSVVSPNPLKTAVVLFVLGGLVGLGLVAARAATDDRLRDVAAYAELWEEPALASVPNTKRFGGIGSTATRQSAADEAVAMVALGLRQAGLGSTTTSMIVTSALEGEGKSTISWQLAEFLGGSGAHVVLVDGDARKRTVTKMAKATEAAGLSDLIKGEHSVQAVPSGAFDVLPAGRQLGTPISLVDGDTISAVVGALSDAYDIVIIDTPPVVPVADALAFCHASDGYLVVGRIGVTTRAAAGRLSATMHEFPVRRLGYVVNGVRLGRSMRYARVPAVPQPAER